MVSFEERLDAFIRSLPKTETHLHLEGALPLELSQELADRHPEFKDRAFRYHSFEEFKDTMKRYSAGWFTSSQNYQEAAKIMLRNLQAENVSYVELNAGLPSISRIAEPMEEVFSAIRAAGPEGMEIKIFLGIGRDDFPRYEKQIEAALQCPQVDGFDLDGWEIPLQDWTEAVWQRARAHGKFTKAHTGEFESPAQIRKVVEQLQCPRYEHGIQAAEDPELMELLRREGITLDICPISNVKLGAARSIQEHPIIKLHRAGVRCTLSTDDPSLFANRLGHEYKVLAKEAGFSFHDLGELAKNGFEAALLPVDEKKRRKEEIDALVASAS